MKTELRAYRNIEKRALSDTEKADGYIGALRGMIPYNSDSHKLSKRGRNNKFIEQIAPGAFDKSLSQNKEIMLMAGHTDNPLSGIARIGENLSVKTDERGMSWEALVPDTAAGRDLVSLVDKGIITGTSFEFDVTNGGESWSKRDASTDERIITEARLHAINPVTWPAYADSGLTVEMRKRDIRTSYFSTDIEYDPTASPDVAFAVEALGEEVTCLEEALEYLRETPDGAFAAYNKEEVTSCAKEIMFFTEWLTKNGAKVDPAMQEKTDSMMSEGRSLVAPKEDFSKADRDRRFRILNLGSL